jgi:type II secretory pathway predicted ATPase ExeA
MPRYREFYGLNAKPFGKSPQQGRPYVYPQVEELNDHLEALVDDGGIGMVTGEIGIGKTTAVRNFISNVDQGHYHICYVGNTRHPRGILKAFVESFGVTPAFLRSDILSQMARLVTRTFLEQRRRTIFVLDEAHTVEDSFLEDLRLATNFEMDSRDSLALILVGHPSLRARLRQPIHAAFADRIVVHYRLEGLSSSETSAYIGEHMQQAGAEPDIFSPEACKALFEIAQGVPRRINRLALACLLKGISGKVKPITAEHVANVQTSLDGL